MSDTIQVTLDHAVTNPLDEIETFILSTNWRYQRISDTELVIQIHGTHCEYHVSVTWISTHDIINIAFSFHVGLSKDEMSQSKEVSITKLITLLNESMQIGHFDIWRQEYSVIWRYGYFFTADSFSHDFLSRLFRTGIDTCDQYYPAFQFVLWAGHSPSDALRFVMFETAGEA